ncbi:MAG: hypothetical protein OXG35_03850 [Acidobacteria bacterium]|nr:hypothetical protein [Acidobacteriota bacterium]
MPDTNTRWVLGTLAVLAGLILQQGAATNARRAVGLAGVIVLVAAGGVAAVQSPEPARSPQDRFALLWCFPFGFEVRVQADGDAYGVTHDRVSVLVESRLRAARLYRDWSVGPELDVHVWFSGPALLLEVAFYRWVEAGATTMSGYAATWKRQRLGTHGRSGDYVMQQLSELVDGFILEYLRVTEDSCGR